MNLLPNNVLNALPSLRKLEGTPLKTRPVPLHIFNPYGPGDWFIMEGSSDEDGFRMFGICAITDAELGYVTLEELDAIRVRILGEPLPLERDIHWPINSTYLDAIARLEEKGYMILAPRE